MTVTSETSPHDVELTAGRDRLLSAGERAAGGDRVRAEVPERERCQTEGGQPEGVLRSVQVIRGPGDAASQDAGWSMHGDTL